MKLAQLFKYELHQRICRLHASTRKRRPIKLDINEGIECLFRLVRTGMQWREVELKSASFTTLFKHAQQWTRQGIIHDAYRSLLSRYASKKTSQHYIIDSTHVKNVYGRVGLGRSPVDRGRKGLKISVLTDSLGVVHNIQSDAANVSDFKLFTPMLSSILIELRKIEVFADRGYDSKSNRNAGYKHNFLPRIMRRRCKSSRRQNAKRVHVEHTFAWIDNFRRLRVQYEHTPDTHIAYILLALGHILCRRFFSQSESE